MLARYRNERLESTKFMANTLFIPGLGGERSLRAQQRYIRLLNLLRRERDRILFFYPDWHSPESYEAKYARLREVYDSKDKPARLIGISAGASLAVTLSVDRPEVESTLLVCGKLLGPEKIGADYNAAAPALFEAVTASSKAVMQADPRKFTCYAPPGHDDGVIEREDMIVPGSNVVSLPALPHAYAIGYMLVRHLPWA